MIAHERCPVCGSTSIHQIVSPVDHTVSLEHFAIWQCANCSLRFTQNGPAPDQIGRYYQSENYISHSETSRGLVNWLYLQVRKITLASKRRFIEEETKLKRGSLLDIGAGAGAFVHHMQQHGWSIEGLEPDDTAIDRARHQYGLNLKAASGLFHLPEASYDVITMWHVLEHVHDLHAYISQIKKISKPGGKVFIAVPNYTSYDAVHYGEAWAAYDVPRHLYHFSPAAMHELMRIHGCAIEKIQPMWFDSFYVSMLSEKYKTGHANLIRGFWTGLRSNLKALKNRRKASSLIYVVNPHAPA